MSIVAERHLDLASLQTAWRGLNKLVPQNQLEVTLVPLNRENLKSYEGKQIAVQGTLYHAHTGHHHTLVLIEIKRIENVSK
jgi:hypothetical protein